ncbi:MAG: PfkB family carbohydrate kinase [Rhizobiaceae bacterium]|jgi:ribokinase|nr:PfkB family carbohydrate kinase [Rhizobiaceae bacterium]
MAEILVVGALHHDVIVNAPRMPALDETLPGSGVTYALGGKGGNQALAAARHGATVAFAGRVGADEAGRSMRTALAAGGVDTSRIAIDPTLASGMSVAIVTQAGDYGAVIVSAANMAIDPAAIEIPGACKVLVLQNEVPEAVNIVVATRARAKGASVMLNAAPARAVTPDLLAMVDILIVNRVEAAMLGEALKGFAGTVIETRGADGALIHLPSRPERQVPAFPVSVISTHGAGDCFVGALAARLAQSEPFDFALAYASAAAALHVSIPVDRRGTITPDDVIRLIGTRHADGH